MKNWWRANEELMKNWWWADKELCITKWSPSGPQVLPQVITKWSSSGHQVVTKWSVDSGCHKLSENIWFAWSNACYKGEKERCHAYRGISFLIKRRCKEILGQIKRNKISFHHCHSVYMGVGNQLGPLVLPRNKTWLLLPPLLCEFL